MIIKSAQFVKSAVRPSHYPPATLPEIAFAGRSNVGKSSLINALVNRKKLAKTSSTPGRTQLINFFTVNEIVMFVDIPGYGYAKVPGSVRKTWGPMIETYLSGRENLKGVVWILDIRRTPGAEDIALAQWLKHHHIQVVTVLTKADKVSRSRQQTRRITIAGQLPVAPDQVIVFSAKTRQGRADVWAAIGSLLNAEGFNTE